MQSVILDLYTTILVRIKTKIGSNDLGQRNLTSSRQTACPYVLVQAIFFLVLKQPVRTTPGYISDETEV